MRMLSGSFLIVASAVFAAGYEIAKAENAFRGGSLGFLAWAFGLAGVGLIVMGWFEEEHKDQKDKEKGKKITHSEKKSESPQKDTKITKKKAV